MAGPQTPSGTARERGHGPARFAAPSESALVEALARAHARGRIVHGRPRDVVRVELDTIDRRLERRGASAVHESDARGGACRLRLADGREWRLGPARPDFAHDLEPGAGREALGALAGERRLLEGARRLLRRRPLKLLDRQGKTVVRVELELDRDPEHGSSEPSAVVTALRGYERVHARLCARLDQEPNLRRVLEEPPDVGASKAKEALPREIPAADGLALLLERRLRTFLDQEAGLRADLDPEFNHDFRVASRRTRSLLGELGKALPEAGVTALREELRWLGGISGPLRDLDVLAAELRETADLPPAELRALLEFLGRRRDAALEALRAGLDGPRFAELVRLWRELAESTATPDGPGAQPFRARLARRLRKRSRALSERAPADIAEAPVHDLHELRIQAKKLRYLLECAHGMVDATHEAATLSVLKRLQECLGALHDAAVQSATLDELSRELCGSGGAPSTLYWLGRLSERAAGRVAAGRAELPGALAAFTAHAARKDFERLVRELDGAP